MSSAGTYPGTNLGGAVRPKPPELTLAYLESWPQSAAQVIEGLLPADGAAFLETVPARIGAPVVSRMAPWAAARCLDQLPPELAAGLVREMSSPDGTTVLRLLPKARLDEVLEQLPRRMASGFAASLKYSSGTVGSWMDHAAPTFAETATVGDGLKFARENPNRLASHIFVVGEKRELVGAVRVADLLHNTSKTPLGEITDRQVRSIAHSATLASVIDLPEWDEYPALPVVGRKRNVLGSLSRRSLRKGLSDGKARARPAATDSILVHVFSGYFVACAGLMRLISPASRP